MTLQATPAGDDKNWLGQYEANNNPGRYMYVHIRAANSVDALASARRTRPSVPVATRLTKLFGPFTVIAASPTFKVAADPRRMDSCR